LYKQYRYLTGTLKKVKTAILDKTPVELAEMLVKIKVSMKINVQIKTMTGRELEIDIESRERILKIKENVEEKEGIPPSQQRLIFGGKQL
jgi:hypothetical protein